MFSFKFLLLVLCISGLPALTNAVGGGLPSPEDETRLLNYLANKTEGLHKYSSPFHDGRVRVELLIELMSFDFKDEAKGLTSMHAFVSQFWNDQRLGWDPKEFGDIEFVLYPLSENIWLPDVTLTGSGTVVRHIVANADVVYPGNISLFDNYIIESKCRLNLRYFPYDKQVCTFTFGSWSWGAGRINLVPVIDDQTEFFYQIENSDFKITKVQGGPHEVSDMLGYSNVDFNIYLERISSAYSVKLILPAVVTGFLILMTFLLPPASQEKVTLGGLIFVSLILQLVNLQNLVPGSGHTIMGDFLAFAICLDFFAILIAVISYFLHKRTSTSAADVGETKSDALPAPHGCEGVMKILRFLDIICFVIFLIVYIIGIAAILGQRE